VPVAHFYVYLGIILSVVLPLAGSIYLLGTVVDQAQNGLSGLRYYIAQNSGSTSTLFWIYSIFAIGTNALLLFTVITAMIQLTVGVYTAYQLIGLSAAQDARFGVDELPASEGLYIMMWGLIVGGVSYLTATVIGDNMGVLNLLIGSYGAGTTTPLTTVATIASPIKDFNSMNN